MKKLILLIIAILLIICMIFSVALYKSIGFNHNTIPPIDSLIIIKNQIENRNKDFEEYEIEIEKRIRKNENETQLWLQKSLTERDATLSGHSNNQTKYLDRIERLKEEKRNLSRQLEFIKQFNTEFLKPTKKFIEGRIGYIIPDSMILNEVSRVALHLSDKNISNQKLKSKVASLASTSKKSIDTTEIEIDDIQLSQRMVAKLTCPYNELRKEIVRIIPLGSDEQIVSSTNNYSAIWQWDVIPKIEGSFLLNLNIEAVIYDSEKKERQINIPVFSKEITVNSRLKIGKKALITIFFCLALIGLSYFIFGRRSKKEVNRFFLSKDVSEKIREKIGRGEIEVALKILEENVKEEREIRNRLEVHKAEYSDTKRKLNMGLLDQSEFSKVSNRINYSLLEIISKIEKKTAANKA